MNATPGVSDETRVSETAQEAVFDKETWLAGQISDRINKNNLNAICIWVGPTGTGKSYSALRLAELVDPTFTISRVVFRPIDFLDLINDPTLAKGNVVLWDEMGLGMPARDWTSVFNKSIGYVLQSFRFRNLALFMTVPDQAFIDSQARRLFHYYFECMGVSRQQEVVIAKPFEVDHSARFDKDYTKYPIVRRPSGPAKVGTIPFGLPSTRLREAYERKRKDFMDAYYRELRESLEIAGEGAKVPEWAWRAVLELASEHVIEDRDAEPRTQAELAGILQVGRQWMNVLLKRANAALRDRPA